MKPWTFSDGTVLRMGGGGSLIISGESQFSRSLAVLLAMDSQACVYCGPGGSEPWTGADYQVDAIARDCARVAGLEVMDAPDVTYPEPPPLPADAGPDTIY